MKSSLLSYQSMYLLDLCLCSGMLINLHSNLQTLSLKKIFAIKTDERAHHQVKQKPMIDMN